MAVIGGMDVIVAGGGIGGLATALLLADAGASVTLLERVAAPTAVGAGILLQPNGLAVLDALGLGEALERAGRRMREPALRSAAGATIATLAPPDFGAGLEYFLAIRRGRLHRLLLDAAADRPSIAVRLGAEVTAARPDGTVELRQRDGRSSIAAELVVGADGIDSTVRVGGDFGAVTAPTGTRYVRGLAGHPPGADLGLEGEYWTALGLFGGAPVDQETTYFYAAVPPGPVADAVDARDLMAFRALWSAALRPAARVLAAVQTFDQLLVNDVVRVDCERWADGRLVLVGDAAHAMAPTVGQGANSAMVDAAILVAELAADQPLPAALERYARRRRAPVRRVQDTADRLARLSGWTNPALRIARDAGLRLLAALDRAAGRQARLVQQEDPAWLHATVLALRARG
jgi:2-polyprenyl-6-methoxyphenol hydroxylase-like FAD-dependent oxidoreductase